MIIVLIRKIKEKHRVKLPWDISCPAYKLKRMIIVFVIQGWYNMTPRQNENPPSQLISYIESNSHIRVAVNKNMR
jgi:hypothetical protein